MFKSLEGLIGVNTEYRIKVIENDELKEEYVTHNTFLNRYFTERMLGAVLMLGSGTTTPTATDTRLTTPLWSSVTFTAISGSVVVDNDNSFTYTRVYRIPANQTYVGTVAELGLLGESTYSGLYTHALILDAEGLPITINKTDLTVLEITVQLQFTISSAAGITHPPIQYTSLYAHYTRDVGNSYDTTGERIFGGQMNYVFSPKYLETWGGISCSNASTNYMLWNTEFCGTNGDASRACTNTLSVASKVNSYTGYRVGAAFYPGKQYYIKGLFLNKMFVVRFTNTDLFPDYEIAGMSVGLGDGVKTVFEPPLAYWKNDTDKVYVDGVLQTRGIDYTIDANNNRMKCPELLESNEGVWSSAEGVSTHQKGTLSNEFGRCPIGMVAVHRATCGTTSSGSPSIAVSFHGPYTLTVDSPVYCDLGVVKPINYALMGSAVTDKAGIISLQYSLTGDRTDASSWVTVATLNNTEYQAGTYSKTFDVVTARYWRYTYNMISSYPPSHFSLACTRIVQTQADLQRVSDKYSYGFGFIGAPITFINPPAEGAAVTMDATLDIPVVTDNRVVDVSMNVSL